MVLKTKRLILCPWEESDAESLYRYASAPEVGPAAGWPVHTSIENSRDVIRNVLSAPETYAVVDKCTGCAVGSIGLMIGKASRMGIPDTEAELGYWIGVPYWGQGLIPEAVQVVLRHAFEELNLEKVWCGYYDGNTKSKRVQEKCGFQYQYTKEKVPCSMLNEVRTEHITCLKKEDWIVRCPDSSNK
ncbi:MAG: GNAT family N-acetyltransferase [Eubacteriales bacterium]|nr:GNAT family N-acetyltransferase [Eubacteriales bacterium]